MEALETKVSEDFLCYFDRISQAREEFANELFATAAVIESAESEAPAKLGLEQEIDSLKRTAQILKDGVFRLLVLGDMKRGKSTFLNAILGELLLPSDVNPCTAILTKLRYGTESNVTVYFNNGKESQSMSLQEFGKNYTIPADLAKQYESEGKMAFPDVSHAEIQYPLPLLEKGVEIIDSPGLNDTEERNNISLGYIQNSQAILFVLSAVQPLTLSEKRYLENYMNGKGLPVFYLINMWDSIRNRLLDPNDVNIYVQKEAEVRQYFRDHLGKSLTTKGKSVYDQRVFEISALNGVRARLGRQGYRWEESGLPKFIDALTDFLTNERAMSELRLACVTERGISKTVDEKATLQISLLSQGTAELKEKINAVQPEFDELMKISSQFNQTIGKIRNETADEISASFKSYFSTIDQTFEEDFARYVPDLKILDFLRKPKREEFQATMEQEFNRYLLDKIADWSKIADVRVQAAITNLNQVALRYAVTYTEVTTRIKATLSEQPITSQAPVDLVEESPLWQRMLAGGLAVMSGDLAGGLMAGSGVFTWKRIFANLGIVVGVTAALYMGLGIALTPIGASLVGVALTAYQARKAREKFFETVKKELSKQLPTMAKEGSEKVYRSVYQQFTDYSTEVQNLMNVDIVSRKDQLNNLLAERESREIDIQAETNRLRELMRQVHTHRDRVETAFDRLLAEGAAANS